MTKKSRSNDSTCRSRDGTGVARKRTQRRAQAQIKWPSLRSRLSLILLEDRTLGVGKIFVMLEYT
jgi:hypothetical protein